MFGIHVLTKLGKQFCIEITCFNVVEALYDCCKLLSFMTIGIVLQTLFGNPKRPVELGNPNTCAETKLCLNFILFRLKK